MTDYISREYILKCMEDSYKNAGITAEAKAKMTRWVNKAPAADVRPVVPGKWRQIGPKEAVCSVCNNVTLTNGIDRTGHANIHNALYHFCPNCGAEMEES